MGAALINTDINEDAVESQQTNTLKTTTTTNWSSWDNCGVPCDTMHVFKPQLKFSFKGPMFNPISNILNIYSSSLTVIVQMIIALSII